MALFIRVRIGLEFRNPNHNVYEHKETHIKNTNAGEYKIYRWESETTTSDPTVAFSGNPVPLTFRWGDTMNVRGSGANTQIIIGSRGSGSAPKLAIFTTPDGSNFTAHGLSSPVTASYFAGGVTFAEGNTFWAKRATLDLRLYSFDLDMGVVTVMANGFRGRCGIIGTNFPRITGRGSLSLITDPTKALDMNETLKCAT